MREMRSKGGDGFVVRGGKAIAIEILPGPCSGRQQRTLPVDEGKTWPWGWECWRNGWEWSFDRGRAVESQRHHDGIRTCWPEHQSDGYPYLH